jgi:hypothetical protein
MASETFHTPKEVLEGVLFELAFYKRSKELPSAPRLLAALSASPGIRGWTKHESEIETLPQRGFGQPD